MFKSTLTLLLVALLVITAQAAVQVNPYTKVTRPLAVGGAFKRLEKRSPSSLVCYNATESDAIYQDFSDLYWADSGANTNTMNFPAQLKSGAILYVHQTGSNYGIKYWDTKTIALVSTATQVLRGSISKVFLSYDQKKLYVVGVFDKVGQNLIPQTSNPSFTRIMSFDISALPTLGAPVEITSALTSQITNAFSPNAQMYAVASGHIVVILGANSYYIYDGANWKQYTTTVFSTLDTSSLTYRQSSSSGELFAFCASKAPPSITTAFYRFDGANSDYFVIVKQLPTILSDVQSANYVQKWTVGGGAIYYLTNPALTGNAFENGMQNVQKITLSPVADPVSLGKTRLYVGTPASLLSRDFDKFALSNYVDDMYFDENLNVLVLSLSGDNALQIYGARETDATKLIYNLNYRFQQVGKLVYYNAATGAEQYYAAYGGNFASGAIPARVSIYATAKVSCFFAAGSAITYYRTWAPNFAVYDEDRDRFVADSVLSGNFDYDAINSAGPSVATIENSDTSGIVYIGGYFRTIGNVVYNSIVSRTATGGLAPLGTGLTVASLDADQFDMKPGSVKKIVRSKNGKYLFVLGSFDRAGGQWVNNLAMWDIEKQTWNSLQTNQVAGNIVDIDFDGTYLYIVGTITAAGNYVVKNAARFHIDNRVWTPMNLGLDTAPIGAVTIGNKLVTVGSTSASGVAMLGNIAIWNTDSWKAIQMARVSNDQGCKNTEFCTGNILNLSPSYAYFKGRIYMIVGNAVYVTDTELTSASLYHDGNINAAAGSTISSYPKKNTIAIVAPGSTNLVEYNTDLKNIQHTTTRDLNGFTDAAYFAFSSASSNGVMFLAALVAIVAMLF